MKFYPSFLEGAFVIQPEPFIDHRGMFARIFCKIELTKLTKPRDIVQINHSVTKARGAIRGFHYQRPPKAEVKIVKCIKGAIYDVIVDLRKGSPTFLKWQSARLSAQNMKMFYIPEGYAHGFQTLEPDSELIYFHTAPYSPEHEGGLRYDDPRLKVQWPLEHTDLSKKDRSHPYLEEDFEGLISNDLI